MAVPRHAAHGPRSPLARREDAAGDALALLPLDDSLYTDGEVQRPTHYNGDYFPPLRGFDIAPRQLPDAAVAAAAQAVHARTGTTGNSAFDSIGTGSYLANAMSLCVDCHTHPARSADNRAINFKAYLSGGQAYGVPPPLQPVLHQVRSMSANLKGEAHGFFNEPSDSFDRFVNLIRTGTHVDETPPRPLGFPMILVAGELSNLIDSDLRALYDYVKVVPDVTGADDAPRQDYAVFCNQDSDCAKGQTCATATHECVGKACTVDTDCAACQTCGNGACRAPAADSACVATEE